MRALFYVEPFPVRNSMTHFASVARRAVALCASRDGFDMRVFGNSETLRLFDEGADTVARDRLLWPTEEEDAFFRSQLVLWETEGIPSWSECMRGGPSSSRYTAVLERIWAEFSFDVILHWGENGVVARFTDDYDLTHIGLELGCSRKPFLDSYVFDPMGTNGAAVVPRLSIKQIERIVDGVETSAEESVLGTADDAEGAFYDDRFSLLPPHLSEKVFQGGGKIAFLALQLFDDANLIQFSKYSNLHEVVLDVVPKLVEAGYLVVIKPHPASRYREGSSQESAIARSALTPYGNQVVWLDDAASTVPNSRLMQVADLIVTVNSSVGFEALYFDKLVVVLGEAVYKPTEVFPTLDQALSGSFDRSAYLRNIGLLRTFFLNAYLVSEKWLTDPQLFAHRVSTLVSIHRQFPNDAFAIANGLYAAVAPGGGSLRGGTLAVRSEDSASGSFVAPKPGGSPRGGRHKIYGFREGVNFQPMLRALKRSSGAEDAAGIKFWLRSQWQKNNTRLDVLRLLNSVDTAWYHKMYPDVKEHGVSPIKHFNNVEEQWRIPAAIFEEGEYSTLPSPRYLNALFRVIDASNLTAVSSDSRLNAEEANALQLADLELAKLLERKPRSSAVIAHLYYIDLVDPLLDRLKHIRDEFDLIVTLPLWGNRRIVEKVKSRFSDAVCLPLPNRGRDIGPFLHVLPALIRRDYRAVLKIQTKKGFYQAGRLRPLLGAAWREYSLDCLAGSSQAITRILRSFERDADLSMVGPAELLLRTQTYPEAIDPDTEGVVGIEQFGEDDVFFAGTMFWMRPVAFSLLANGRFAIQNFSSDPESSHGELEHVVERLFGHLARRDGKRIAGTELNATTGEVQFDRQVKPNLQPLPEVMQRIIDATGITVPS